MTVKTDVSRFHIHDELTAPDGSAPLIKSIQTAGGAVSKFIGVLAGSPAALRGYTRLRTELARAAPAAGDPRADRPRRRRVPRRPLHPRPVRAVGARAGLGLDEVARARNFTSGDEGGGAAHLPRGDR